MYYNIYVYSHIDMSRFIRKNHFVYGKTKVLISCADANCTADQHLCFPIYKMIFSDEAAHINMTVDIYIVIHQRQGKYLF